MIYSQQGYTDRFLTREEIRRGLYQALDTIGPRRRVLVVPPDFTRFHSHAGMLTEMIWEYYGDSVKDILPALGTHLPMSDSEISLMFGEVPRSLFRVHNWRSDVETLGTVPEEFVRSVSEERVRFSWPAQVNRLVAFGGHDLVLSVGQVVPHEVIGMANYNKNLFVGTGGREGISKSHFLGAAYGMERIMGRADNPVRRVLNYASEHFAAHLPVVYIQTVVSGNGKGSPKVNGLYIGNDRDCFDLASDLSLRVNFERVEEPLKKIVVWLDPAEFRSTWLGNKSIYRTRMAMADHGELVVLAPGVSMFGEDPEIDSLIRRYGYAHSDEILSLVREREDLAANLAAAAHLIHGTPDNRFKVTYCPGVLTRSEIESVHFNYADLDEMIKKYDPKTLKDGYNLVDGEEVFFISNPALGLWAHPCRLA